MLGKSILFTAISSFGSQSIQSMSRRQGAHPVSSSLCPSIAGHLGSCDLHEMEIGKLMCLDMEWGFSEWFFTCHLVESPLQGPWQQLSPLLEKDATGRPRRATAALPPSPPRAGGWCLNMPPIRHHTGASQVAPVVKSPPAKAGYARDSGSIPGSGRSLEEGLAIHSSILA